MNEMWRPQARKVLAIRGLLVPVVAMMITFASQPAGASDLPTFTKQAELEPIVLSYGDVDQLVASLESQIAITNGKDSSDRWRKMSLSVKAGEETKSVYSWRSLSDGKGGLPEPGLQLDFGYSSYEMPVRRVEISLNDYQRRIIVEGTDRGQVDGIFAYIKDTLSRRIRPWQGPRMRSIGGFVALNIGVQLIWLPFSMRSFFRRFYTPAKIMSFQALGVLIVVSVYALPWGTLLPGFAVYSSIDNTFRMTDIASIVLAVLTPSSLAAWFWPKRNSAKQSANRSTSDNDIGD
jgi:hypothetical protein